MTPHEFLNQLWADKPSDLYTLIWTLQDKRSRWFRNVEEAAAFVESCHHMDVYVGVGLSPEDFGPSHRCPSDKIAGLAGFWADFDLKSDAHPKTKLPITLADALSVIPTEMAPTLVVATGNGAHAWWLFKEPLMFDSDEERRQASRLVSRWQTLLRLNAAGKGWAFDRLSDLARVLRIPGTVNAKDPRNPKDVIVHSNSGRRFNPSDFAEFLDEAGVADPETGNTIARDWGENLRDKPLTVDPKARIPQETLDGWMALDMRFKNTWLRQRHDLQDQSQSGYDLALAHFGLEAGLSEQQIVDLIVHHRAIHSQKLRTRLDYFERTLRAAANRQEPIATPPPSVAAREGEPDAAPQDSAVAKAHLCERLSQALQVVRVLQLIKITGEEPTYVMELADATIKFSNVAKLIDQKSVRVAIAAATNRLIPRIKPKAWEQLAQTMLDALTEREGGDETDAVGATKMYLARYLSETAFIPSIESQPIQSAHKPTVLNGQIAISASDFQMHLNKVLFQNLSVKGIAQMLTVIGARSLRIRGARLRDQSRWLLPTEMFDPADFVASSDPPRQAATDEETPDAGR
jgi:hypothetical protein